MSSKRLQRRHVKVSWSPVPKGRVIPSSMSTRPSRPLQAIPRRSRSGRTAGICRGSDRLQPEIAQIRKGLTANESVDVTLRNYRKNGELFWNNLHLRVIAGLEGNGSYIVGLIRDVTSARSAEAALLDSSQKDRLTGCYNRDAFVTRLEKADIPDGHSVVVVKVDIVRFREINAGFGYDSANALLRTVCERLGRTRAILVGRLNGNEFVLAFVISGEDEIQDCLGEVAKVLRPNFTLPGLELTVRFATGYVIAGPNWVAMTLVRQAGLALLTSKTSPLLEARQYDRQGEELTKSRIRLTGELHLAVANNEFIYHFQPKIDLSTGEIVGAEALARWNHPLFGLQFPDRFIAIAEETGLILDLDERGLREVARYAVEINKNRKRPLNFAFNFSAKEFAERDIVALVRQILGDTGIDPSWLTLELTEGLLIHNEEEVIAVFQQLRNLGVGLSIDDFGTGYSSLRYLDKFPISEIKIDRAFVKNMTQSRSKKFIVKAVIDLGRELDFDVVAEGIETETERALLVAMGCPFAQGYLFARPMDKEAFAKLVHV
jgi:diguanylate cyclase (GGDEF)-like protein